MQVQAGTSDGTISLSNVISYTTEGRYHNLVHWRAESILLHCKLTDDSRAFMHLGDCDSVAYSVLIFGVLAISLGFSVGLCFGINVLCQLKRKARPDLT